MVYGSPGFSEFDEHALNGCLRNSNNNKKDYLEVDGSPGFFEFDEHALNGCLVRGLRTQLDNKLFVLCNVLHEQISQSRTRTSLIEIYPCIEMRRDEEREEER